MTSPAESPPFLSPPRRPPARAPFLVWPVARREFYLTIQMALVPAFVWASLLFGWRVLAMTIGSLLGVTVTHALLKRFGGKRGATLVYAHATNAAFILVALCHPAWPLWLVAAASALITPILWVLGAGRERIHIPIVLAVLLQLAALLPGVETTSSGGILARDRLFMGDIRTARGSVDASFYHWPSSSELSGEDALRMARPVRVAYQALDRISGILATAPLRTHPTDRTHLLQPDTRRDMQSLLDTTLSSQLPPMEYLILGVVPGQVATVSPPAILLAGLYLAFRYILRPRSVLLFLSGYLLGMMLFLFSPAAVSHMGLLGLWGAMKTMPGELLTLLQYAFFNSDVLFAAVFVLALPGTQPLTRRGRRVFLLASALLGALLARLSPSLSPGLTLPTATLALALLMPAAPLLDKYFAKRSWLSWTMT